MRKFLMTLIIGWGMFITSPSSAYAKVNIFACEPEWASLAEEIGGNLVDVTSATNAHQDVHYLRAKPSLLAAMRRADIVFCTGGSLEVGWLPILLKKTGGPDVQLETIGSIMAFDYVEKLEMMSNVDRSMGHVHPEGNPHIQLDPNNIKIIAEVLADRLFIIDPDNASQYQSQLETFVQKWDQALQKWNNDKASLRGKKIVVYHNSWAYLLKWLGVKSVVSLEPKPGLPPTAAHLETVLKTVKDENISAIIVAPFENKDAANWLSKKSGIPVIELPFTVGGNKETNNLFSLFDETIRLLK